MTQENYGFKTGDSVKQQEVFEKTRIANAKEQLIKKAETEVINMLKPLYGQSVQACLGGEHLTEVDKTNGIFVGTISIKASIPTEQGIKVVMCPLVIEKDKFRLPDIELVQRRIKGEKGSVDKEMEDKLEKIKENVSNIMTQVKMNQEISERVERGEDLDKVTAEVRDGKKLEVKKEAAEYEMDSGAGGVVDRSIADIPAVVHVNKVCLPAAIKAGDVINITGYRYKVVGSSPALSSGKDDGGQWVLSLLVATE